MKGLFFVLLICTLPARAFADTTLDALDDSNAFTAPGNAVGPWQTRTFTIREDGGTRDTPGLIFINRIDSDQAAPTHSNGVTVDDYHTWTPGFFTYVSLGAAAGTVLPNRSAYLEGDLKAGSLVLAGAASTFVNPNQTVLNQLSVGPAYYWPSVNAEFRFMPGWINPGGYLATYLLTVTAGLEHRATTTISLQAGAVPPYTNPLLVGTDQRALAGSVLYKRWIGSLGLDAGLDYAYVTRPSTASLIYIQRGFSLGTFATIK